MTLSPERLRRLHSVFVDLYALRDKGALIAHLLATLPSLIDADLFSYIEADPVQGRFAAVRTPTPDSEEMLDIFAPMAPEHPIIQHIATSGSDEAFRVGDFVSRQGWHEMPMYSEFMRPERIEHQLGVALPLDSTVMTFVATHRSGGTDFSDADRAMLTALAPHVTRAILNAELLSRVEHGGEAIEATASGRIRFTTTRARQWLADYFGAEAARADHIPSQFRRLLRQDRSRGLVFARGERRLTVRRLWRGDILLLILSEDEFVVPRLQLQEFELSPREIEVAAWLAHGKSNDQIAELLQISEWTVKKHLTRVFEKLGVDGRTAAALRVRELCGARR